MKRDKEAGAEHQRYRSASFAYDIDTGPFLLTIALAKTP